jgi:hypothetical protein
MVSIARDVAGNCVEQLMTEQHYKWSARKPDRIEGRFQSSQPFQKLFHEEGRASAAMIKDDISSRRMIIFSISIPPLISS